jgi:hypothetical protein
VNAAAVILIVTFCQVGGPCEEHRVELEPRSNVVGCMMAGQQVVAQRFPEVNGREVRWRCE